MNENTTNSIPGIIETLNGYVVIPLEMLERLEQAETTLGIIRSILRTVDRYDACSILRKVAGVRYEKPAEEDEE
jgi:hypothetical protein